MANSKRTCQSTFCINYPRNGENALFVNPVSFVEIESGLIFRDNLKLIVEVIFKRKSKFV